jgi:hypothetical protein
VHCVCTQDKKISPGQFEGTAGLSKHPPDPGPIAGALEAFHFVKVNAQKDQLGGMQSAKAISDCLIDDPIIWDR